MNNYYVSIIIGSGLCGLSAGYHFEQAGCGDYLILEANSEVGGLCRTEVCNGYSFDHSIHILYTKDPYVSDLITNRLLTGNINRQVRESFCFTAGIYTEYPYQANNFGLPAEVIAQNLLGLIESQCIKSFDRPPANFEDWILRTFGRGIADNFMIPYNRRQWAWDLKTMNYNWIAERVPRPDIREVLLGALRPPAKKYGPNHDFWYPREGGIQALPQAFMRHIPSERVWLRSQVVAIDPDKHELTLSDNRQLKYEWLISSTPLPFLIKMMGEAVPKKVKESAGQLKHNVVHTVNLGLEGESLGIEKPMHWAYFPEDQTIFHRINFPHRFSSWMAPLGCSSIQAEISESGYRPLNRATLIADTLDGLVRVGILSEKEIRPWSAGGRVKVADAVTLTPAYVIYDLQHRQNLQVINDFLKQHQIESRGRFGEWEYFNMDHSILSGKKAVEKILETNGGGKRVIL